MEKLKKLLIHTRSMNRANHKISLIFFTIITALTTSADFPHTLKKNHKHPNPASVLGPITPDTPYSEITLAQAIHFSKKYPSEYPHEVAQLVKIGKIDEAEAVRRIKRALLTLWKKRNSTPLTQ